MSDRPGKHTSRGSGGVLEETIEETSTCPPEKLKWTPSGRRERVRSVGMLCAERYAQNVCLPRACLVATGNDTPIWKKYSEKDTTLNLPRTSSVLLRWTTR